MQRYMGTVAALLRRRRAVKDIKWNTAIIQIGKEKRTQRDAEKECSVKISNSNHRCVQKIATVAHGCTTDSTLTKDAT
jgi:hypothetical protein